MRKVLVALLFVLPIGLCHAQSAPARPAEPTAIGVVYRLDPATQELKRLPDEEWKESQGARNPGDLYVVVTGGQSTFRIKAGDKIEFVFNTGSPEKVSLYGFIQKKSERRFEFQKQPSTWKMEVAIVKGLTIDVSKFGESSYKLVPASPLAPGEYAIIIAGNLYSFGVDQ
ncbi:MAG: hypothetical protein ABR906_04045 [Terracidiphilus sp.]|jgi:hypothetical protein